MELFSTLCVVIPLVAALFMFIYSTILTDEPDRLLAALKTVLVLLLIFAFFWGLLYKVNQAQASVKEAPKLENQ